MQPQKLPKRNGYATSDVAGEEWLFNLGSCRSGMAMQPRRLMKWNGYANLGSYRSAIARQLRRLTERNGYATSEVDGAEKLCNFGG